MRKIFLLICLALVIWTFFIEPNTVTIKKIQMHVDGLQGLKIVFVGDFHIKPSQKSRLVNIVEKINDQNPDLILSTGDFVSGHDPKQSMSIENIAKELSNLKSKYGFFTVLGNHDWWQGGEKIEKILEQNGVFVLGNENKSIKTNSKKIYIAGVEDINTREVNIVKALRNTQPSTILLTHSPDVFPFLTNDSNSKIAQNVSLTLAGHTHGGQIRLPFLGALVVPSSYGEKYAQGIVEENGKIMFVTKGLGTSILPVRFNCLPEIVVFNFE